MTHRSFLLVLLTGLLLGLALGVSIETWSFSRPAQANALDAKEANRLYDELANGSNALMAGSRLLNKIASVTTPSVVHIQSERRDPRRGTVEETGAGVIVTSPEAPGHFVVTNWHVVADASPENITIRLADRRELHPERLWSDRASDLAVMKIEADDLRPARWGDSDQVGIGHMVLAMGSPFGLSKSVTFGIVSAKGRRSLRLGSAEVLNQNFLQTDAAINPGNSGGPLIDLRGRVIGINTAIASGSGGNDGIGFSIPSNLVHRVVNELLAHGKVRRAYLGVKLDPDFDAESASRLELERLRGARVIEVYPETPAAKAGLTYNDVILRFNGTAVQDENHLINLVSLTPVQQSVSLVVWRNGARKSLTVVLGDRSELQQRS